MGVKRMQKRVSESVRKKGIRLVLPQLENYKPLHFHHVGKQVRITIHSHHSLSSVTSLTNQYIRAFSLGKLQLGNFCYDHVKNGESRPLSFPIDCYRICLRPLGISQQRTQRPSPIDYSNFLDGHSIVRSTERECCRFSHGILELLIRAAGDVRAINCPLGLMRCRNWTE